MYLQQFIPGIDGDYRILVLDGGVVRAFGPRNDVLRQTVQNHLSIRDDIRAGGVA